eukprot:m.244940 g.244940  ORF g.244940 m.244940 type:complete len:461 (+) comp40249_c0_seq41:17-1399(+)
MAAKANLGGYDESFVEPLSKDLECPVCLSAMRNPILTICGHNYCKSCLLHQQSESGEISCPQCHQELDNSSSKIFPENKLNRKILSLHVKCRLCEDGCPWRGELRQIEVHLEECSFVKEECPQECGQVMVRSEKSEHLECHCPKRMVDCFYCDESMHCDQLQEHEDLCLEKPIPCILCEREVQRDKMAEHASTDCPKVKIECIYVKVGCNFKCERALLDDHLKNAAVDHNKQLLADLMKQKESLAKQEQSLKSQQQEIKIERKEIKKQQKKMKRLQEEIKMGREDFKKQQKEMKRQQEETEKQQEEVKKLLLSAGNCLSWNDKPGTFLWAVKTELRDQESAVYYTDRPGYKIRFHCNKVSIWRRSINMVLLEGEYDQAVALPARFSCSVSVSEDMTPEKNIVEGKIIDYTRNEIMDLKITIESVPLETVKKLPAGLSFSDSDSDQTKSLGQVFYRGKLYF